MGGLLELLRDIMRNNNFQPKTCAFCGAAGKLTREHFWPQWMHSSLPKVEERPEHNEFLRVYENGKLLAEPKNVSRQGATWTKTLRVVCSQCNNGWMSAVENDAKVILAALMAGLPLLLSASNLQIVVRWIALKMLLADVMIREDTVCAPEDRKAFKEDALVPQGFHIWIGKTRAYGWTASFFERHACTLATNRCTVPKGKNLQCMTFGVGHLLVHAVIDQSPAGFGIQDGGVGKVFEIWPHTPPESPWPPPYVLTVQDCEQLAGALHAFLLKAKFEYRKLPAS